jgi:pyruvate dehydrogenase E1 component alpha subunit
LIEAKTYRHSGHSRADPATYRPDGELDAWLKRDPIPMYRQRLLDFGIAETDVAAMEEDVLKRVDEATEAAKASSPPSPDVIATEVWADGGSAWRN